MRVTGWMTAVILVMATSVVAAPERWEKYRSAHFEIFYKDVPEAFVKEVEDAAEDYYVKIIDEFGFSRYTGWSYSDPAKIYIYQDQDDYLKSSQQADWSHGAAFAATKIIRTFPSAHGFFDSTLPHELGHIIFREYIGQQAVIPLWFEEGAAMYVERAKRWGAHGQVRDAIKAGNFLTLGQLSSLRLGLDTPREEVELFYAESASVVNYLIMEYGQGRFVGLCNYLRDGKTMAGALRIAYQRFESLDDLNAAWVKYLDAAE